MDVGDLVKVETKYNGSQVGTILRPSIVQVAAWVIWIPNHPTSFTIASERDLEIINENR